MTTRVECSDICSNMRRHHRLLKVHAACVRTISGKYVIITCLYGHCGKYIRNKWKEKELLMSNNNEMKVISKHLSETLNRYE